MVDLTLSGISSSQTQQNLQRANARLQLAIATLASGSRINKASDDVASLSIATQLQTEVSSLKQISGNLAQASSLAQVASGGVEQIQQSLEQLRTIATQANSPVLSEANRQQLNEQFQQVVQEIDRIAGNTTFNGKQLLNGDLTGDNAISVDSLITGQPSEDDSDALSIESLDSESLFEGLDLDVLSAENASQAVDAIGAALNRATSTRAGIGAFQQAVDFAAASIDSAVANQEAARSILQDTDFAETSTLESLINIQRDASLALAAQGNRLNPVLLQLIG